MNVTKKLHNGSVSLKSTLDIRQAIKSGNDKRYITKEKMRKNFKPILGGKHIEKYLIKDPKLYIDYGNHLACPRDPKIFEQPKILIREAGKEIIATYDEQNYHIMSSLYNAILIDNGFDLKYLLSLLNSKLFQHLMKLLTFDKTKGAFTKAKIYHYYNLPIKKIDHSTQSHFVSIVNRILSAKQQNKNVNTTNLENQIDELVYKLYDLTPEEIKIVEGKHEDAD